MSDREEQFWNLVEGVLDHANRQASAYGPALVSDALLYAAARFNAYTAAVNTDERKEFKEELADIKSLLMEQFEMMLDDNLADYLENYKVYLERR